MSHVTNKEHGDEHMMEKIKTEFEDVFNINGCLEGEYSTEIDKIEPTVKLPKGTTPVALMIPVMPQSRGA